MKQIRIKCYFIDSEKTIANCMLMGKQKIAVRKIIDPIAMMRSHITGEQYDIFGKEEEVDSFIEYLMSKDYDIDIEEQA